MTLECRLSSRDTMWTYDLGLKSHRSPPLSIKPEGPIQFSTPVDCHLLSDCCSPACYLSPSTKYVNSPSAPLLPCLISLWHLMEEADSAGPAKPSEESTATVKTACAASLSAPYPPWEATPPPLHGTLGVNCLNVHFPLKAEIPSHCSMTPQPMQPPDSGLKGQWMSFQSMRDKMSLTSPESHPHS